MTKTQSNVRQVEVGDIFYESWGYDQTNINWYQVVGVTPSGKSVRVREVRSEIVEGRGGPSERVVPVKDGFIEDDGTPYGESKSKVMTKRLRPLSDGTPSIKIRDYGTYGWLWSGTPRHRTGFGYGH